MAETTLGEIEQRKEARATATKARYQTYLSRDVYHIPAACTQHAPFAPTNMDSTEDLALTDAELTALLGDDWCHVQTPNPAWNQFFLDGLHYTVGEWQMGRESDWQEGPPWLKISLAQWVGPQGEQPYASLLQDEEVVILTSGPEAKLHRIIT